MKIVSIVGARPQFVKLAPIEKAMNDEGSIEHIIVHTGQHYDPKLSDIFFEDLGIHPPDYHLGVGSGSHGEQTGAMLSELDKLLSKLRPDWTLVYGDTNSTLAGALAAAKLHLPVAHLEAGLRSNNRAMPEEINRIVTDHVSDLLLAPTEASARQLVSEGLGKKTVVVGDVMTDVCLETAELVRNEPVLLPDGLSPENPYAIATLHRAENTDDAERLRSIVEALQDLPIPVVLLVHPRLRDRCRTIGINLRAGALYPAEPLGYPQLVRAVMSAQHVITDSGGLQKEALLLGTPCTTIRTETEWEETLQGGWNALAPSVTQIRAKILRDHPKQIPGMPYGEGKAAVRVVDVLSRSLPC